jgi:hypothetical protein
MPNFWLPRGAPLPLEKLIGGVARSLRLIHRGFQTGDFLLEQGNALGQVLAGQQIKILPDLVRDFFLRLVVFVDGCNGTNLAAARQVVTSPGCP